MLKVGRYQPQKTQSSHLNLEELAIWKNYNVKIVNVVTRMSGFFVSLVPLKISRCCIKSNVMKVSGIVIYIMKIM